MARIVSYNGFDLTGEVNDYYAGIPFDQGGSQWSLTPTIVPRRNDQGEITSVTIEPRPIITQITYHGDLGYEAAFAELTANLNPFASLTGGSDNLPLLVIELNDPDDDDNPIVLAAPAMITLPRGLSQDGAINFITVSFLATDPLWRSITPITETTAAPVAYNTFGGLDNITVEGMAPVNATIRLTPSSTGGFTQARTFTITNNGSRTMRNFPVRVTIGDAYSDITVPVDRWFAILVDGVQQRAEFIRNQDQLFYVWFVVPYLAPGQTVDCMIIKNAEGLPEFPFNSYTQPAFNYHWTIVSAVSGTTTSADFGSPGWETDMWDDGVIEWMDGPNAGQTRRITSNDDDQINWTTPLGSAAASGNTALIRMSSNGYWTWRVQQTERNDNQRGMWWINQGQKKPAVARYDVPGGWKPELFLHNTDVMNQSEWCPSTLNDIGSSADYFSILDVDYSWTAAATFKQGLRANGVSISMPFEITQLKFNDQFKNPNGMCKLILGGREAGTGDYTEEWKRETASDTLEIHGTEHSETLSDDTYQIFLGVVPRNDANDAQLAELGPDWPRDDGTATSGTSTQLNDNTKSWLSDQWIGAQCRIVSGTGAGQNVTVTDSGSNFINATFSTAPDNTSRYRLKLPKQIATARTDSVLSMSWDTTNLVISSLSAWEDVYLVDRPVYVDRDSATAAPPYQYLDMRPDTTGRHLVMHPSETLAIGGEEMRAWIEADPSFVGQSTVITPASGANAITMPAGTADGDTVVTVLWQNGTAVLTPPAGQTLVQTASLEGYTYVAYVGISDGASSMTWTYSATPGGTVRGAVALVYRDAGDVVSSDTQSDNPGTTAHTVGPVTATDSESLVVIFERNGVNGVDIASFPTFMERRTLSGTNVNAFDGVDSPLTGTSYTINTASSQTCVLIALVFSPTRREVRPVPPRALVVRDVEADGTERLAERWLWLTPGTHDVKLGTSDEHNAYDLSLTYEPGYFA